MAAQVARSDSPSSPAFPGVAKRIGVLSPFAAMAALAALPGKALGIGGEAQRVEFRGDLPSVNKTEATRAKRRATRKRLSALKKRRGWV